MRVGRRKLCVGLQQQIQVYVIVGHIYLSCVFYKTTVVDVELKHEQTTKTINVKTVTVLTGA